MPKQDRSLDDLPLAAYGGSGVDDEIDAAPDAAPAARPPRTPVAPVAPVTTAAAAAPPSLPVNDLPVPEDELPQNPGLPSGVADLAKRAIHLFRTSRVAAGAGFAAVVVIGLLLLSGGGASPGATAATPSKGPTAAPTTSPASGDASIILSGAVSGTFPLIGLPGGQHVDATTVALGWGDAQQMTLSIAGPLDRGTRTTDERLVLTLGALVNGVAVTFTSDGGECTVGMANVAAKVQGSFSCKKLKSADGKLTIEASGNYRT